MCCQSTNTPESSLLMLIAELGYLWGMFPCFSFIHSPNNPGREGHLQEEGMGWGGPEMLGALPSAACR